MQGSDNIFTNQSSYCPVSGLSIISKSEWTDIKLDSDYSTSFSIIGKAILLITSKGYPTEKGAKSLLEKRASVIKEAGLSEAKYVEIRDYRLLSGSASKGARMVLTNYVLEEGSKGHLLGFWVFGPTFFIRLMFQAGMKLLKVPIPVGIANDYSEAIRNAVKLLRQNGIDEGVKHYPRYKNDGWALELDGYGISFELIGDDILYTVAHGKLKEVHIEQFKTLHEKVILESDLAQKGYFYRIVNWERFESCTWKVGKMYIEVLKEINRKTKCRLLVGFGLNSFTRKLVKVSSPFVSIPMVLAKDLFDSLEIIEKEREREIEVCKEPVRKNLITYTEEQVKGFATEILQFIGEINWDQKGISLEGINEEHPLKSVLDALTVIKLDLDNIFQEKEISQKSLRESETLQRTLLANLPAGIIIVDPITRKIDSVNSAAANMVGMEAEKIIGHLCHEFLCPDKGSSCPVLDLGKEIENTEREIVCADGSIRPVLKSVKRVQIRGKEKLLECFVDITERKRAAEAVKASEEKYRSIFENSVEGIFQTSPDGRFFSINPALARMMGFNTVEEMMNSYTDIEQQHYVRHVDRAVFKQTLEKYGIIKNFETELYRKDRSNIWVSINAQAFRDRNGKLLYYEGTIEDISERKKTEDALRNEREKFRILSEYSPFGMAMINRDGTFAYINPKFKELFGYNLDDIPDGRTWFRKAYPDKDYRHTVISVWIDQMSYLKQGGRDHNNMFVVTCKDGTEKIVNFVSVMLGTGTYILTCEDVTERKLAEDALRESEEKYRNILDSIEDGYFELDLTGNFIFFNPSICRMLGYSKEEITGMSYKDYMNSGNTKKLFQVFREIYRTGIPAKGIEWEIIQKDGTRKYIEGSISTIETPECLPIGFRGTVRDITGNKMIETIEHAKMKAEAANKAKSQFLANMSHEIRTPLNGVIGMTDIALEMATDETLHGILTTINREAESLLSVINGILDFSKIEAGRMDLESIPFNLRTTIDDLLNGFELRALQKGLKLKADLNFDIHCHLIGDPGRLRQILVNLIGNAIKFTSTGEVSLRCELLEDTGENALIHFSIKDTGIGIPKDKQESIFESFTQVDDSITRKYGGTGLGTTISRMLVSLMGGELKLESEEGKGTTFWFDLVFKKNSIIENDHEKQQIDFQYLKILIVDDNRNNLFMLREYLKPQGCHIIETSTAAEALSVLDDLYKNGDSIDLILLDYLMPDMNGFELARRIRSKEEHRQIRCILLTSSGNIGDGKICREIGIQGYMTKPVRRDELYNSIEAVMRMPEFDKVNETDSLVTRHTIKENYKNHISILLIEDYPTNQQIVIKYLRSAGYSVDLAENGAQAIQAFKEKTYDLLLMDIQMPIMDGFEATQEIRRIEAEMQREKKVPIVAMTAHVIMDYIGKCIRSGMDDYISKPIKKNDLLVKIEKWTSRITINNNTQSENLPAEENNNSEEAPPIYYNEILHEFGEDRNVLNEVIDGFVENVEKQLKMIRQAIADGDAALVKREAHSIKGGAANLHAFKLSEIALMMENLGKEENLQGLSNTFPYIEEAFGQFKNFVETVKYA